MSEIFKNFVKVVNATNSEFIIVPSGIENNNETSHSNSSSILYNVRDVNSVCQLHSMYISQVDETRINGSERFNPKNFKSVDLYIRDINNPDVKIYIGYDIRIVPGSPFYIEKNITLEPSQYLCAYCSTQSKDIDLNNNNTLIAINNYVNLNISCNGILLVNN